MVFMIMGVNMSVNVQEIYEQAVEMKFVENDGQKPEEVAFYTLHPSTVFILRNGTIIANGVKMEFGSRPERIRGSMLLSTRITYFGGDRTITSIPSYRRVVLEEIYPGIDAVLTASGRGVVEFQFVVEPGANPDAIRITIEGGAMEEREDGIFVVKDGKEVIRLTDMRAYQGASSVELRAVLEGNTLSFVVGEYDPSHAMVIDPVLTTIVAGSGGDIAMDIAMDADGNFFIAGYTSSSSDLAENRHIHGTASNVDAFVIKLDNTLRNNPSTAILGTDSGFVKWDEAHAVAVGSDGSVYVAGYTTGPTRFATNRHIFGNLSSNFIDQDAFVARLSNDLTQNLSTAILASSEDDWAFSIAIDAFDNIYVSGYTDNSSNFAENRNTFGTTGGWDAFVARLNSDLTQNSSTAILAGSGDDYARDIAIDNSGFVYVAGNAGNSSDFATNRHVFGATGGYDAFVAKLNNALIQNPSTAILASDNADFCGGIAVDDDGYVYVAGGTNNSSGFATNRRTFGTTGGWDAFVAKLNGNLTQNLSTAILASSSSDLGYDVVLDGSGYVYVAGITLDPSGFAENEHIFGTTGRYDAFVAKLNDVLTQNPSTAILAGSNSDYAEGLVMDNGNYVYVAGYTFNSSDFAPNSDTIGTTGNAEVFVTKINSSLTPVDVEEMEQFSGISVIGGDILLSLERDAYVGMDIYDPSGRLVRRLSIGYLPAGKYRFSPHLPSGSYIVHVRMGERVMVNKLVIR